MTWNALTAPAIEHRALPAGTVELRTTRGRPVIAGLAAPFGKLSRDLGGFVEEIAPTAFRDSQGRRWPDVVARYNHDSNFLLGTSHTEGRPFATLRLDVSRAGLHYQADPPRARADVVELVERGDVRHSSFAFRTIEDEWGVTPQGYPLRRLVRVQLIDVAPVSDPAYRDTSSALRSLALAADADVNEVRELALQDNLLVLWDGGRHPRPIRRGALLGATARQRIDRLATTPGRG